MKKRYSDPLLHSAVMLSQIPDFTGSVDGEETDPNQPFDGRFLGVNGDVTQGTDLEVNGTGSQEDMAEGGNLLGVQIENQVTNGSEVTVLDKATGETEMETPAASGPEDE